MLHSANLTESDIREQVHRHDDGRGQTLTGNVLPVGWVERCVVPAAPVAAEHLRARQSERRNRQSQRAGQQRAVGKKFVGRSWLGDCQDREPGT